MSRILTVEQAAEKLQMSAKVVRQYLRQGKLPGRKVGKAWRVLEGDVEWYVGGHLGTPRQGARASVLGICADLRGFSTQEFIARKQQEVELEDAKLTREAEAGT